MANQVLVPRHVPKSPSAAPVRRNKLDFDADLGNARRLVRRHGKNLRFVPEWGKWIVWKNCRWEIDNDGAVMRLAKDTIEALYSEAVGSANEQKRTALLKHALRSQGKHGSKRWPMSRSIPKPNVRSG